VLEESSSYTVTAVPGGGLNYLPQVDPVSSEARLFLLDVPLIRDSDDAGRAATGHYWAAAAYFDPPWRGAVLFASDDGAVYVAADETLDAVAWGVARTALPDTDLPFQTDLTSQLQITMVSGSLASISNLEMLNGANLAALIRADGNAELIQFQDVALSDGVYTLTTLLRGRRGTEVFTGGHAVGDLFVMLGGAGVTRRPLGLDRLGVTLHYRAVGRGGELRDARTEQLTLAGNDLKPYAPAQLEATGRWGSNITLSWVRRTRVGGALIDGTGEVPLAEDGEEYELEILGPNDDVRRTVVGLTSPTFTYTTAMQAEDFPEGYPASAFVVYQISAQVGRGFAARFDFSDAPQLTTLGETIAEGQAGSGTSNFPADTVMAQRYTGIAGQVLSASAYLGSSATGNMRIGLYADNAGEPGALIATTEEKAFSATGSGHREELTFTSPPTTVGGVKYWLACHTDVSVNSRGSDGTNQNDARRLISQSYASGLPDPFGSSSSYSNTTRGLSMKVWTNP
jgi:hypothetical protein